MIARIKIENYRSIEHVEFSPTQLCGLVGHNNAGKSNILGALDVLLGETYPTERAFTKDDFFNRETDRTIRIEVEFDEPLDPVQLTIYHSRDKRPCEAKSLRLTYTKRQDVNFKHQFLVLDLNGDCCYANDEVRKQVQFVYLPSDRNLEKQLTVSQWTMLGKMLKRLDEEFREGPKGDDGLTENERTLRERMAGALDVLKTPAYLNFESLLKTNVKDQTQDSFKNVDLFLDVYDPLHYYKTIQLLVREFEKDFNVADLGSGLQNLILLAIFRTYARIMKSRAVLAIEEPEIFLHPHAQRKLYRILRSLSEPEVNRETGEVINEGAQIFYATHSPAFLSLPDYDEIFLVRRNDAGKTDILPKGAPLSQGERDELKLLTQFNQHRNELFFARKVMLVEGQTEKHALPLAFAKKLDIDAKSISVIEVAGKGNLPFFIKVLSSLGIEWCAVYDTDSDKLLSPNDERTLQERLAGMNAELQEARDIRKRLDDHADTMRRNGQIANSAAGNEARLFSIDPNFESVCGLPAQRTEEWKKTKQAIEKFTSYDSWDEIPEPIRAAIEFLLRCPESDWPDVAPA